MINEKNDIFSVQSVYGKSRAEIFKANVSISETSIIRYQKGNRKLFEKLNENFEVFDFRMCCKKLSDCNFCFSRGFHHRTFSDSYWTFFY